MSTLDFNNFDDDDNEEGKPDRFEDELKKYKDMLGDGSSEITNIEALEEIVTFYFDNERFEEALRIINRLLTFIPYSADAWQRKGSF
jgi:transcription elongation factor GreA-like protein